MHGMAGLNKVIFRDAYEKPVFARYRSLFPGLGFAAGHVPELEAAVLGHGREVRLRVGEELHGRPVMAKLREGRAKD
ncbi:hypothetical protein ON010_g1502 [Phytophthora cinnamomi]|nr:hypothetical protein ON010_g1502 [Phytophthora cinnamomi]